MDLEFAGVGEVELDRAVGTLVLAFVTDPFLRWIYPEPGQYLEHFPEALLAFGGVAFSTAGPDEHQRRDSRPYCTLLAGMTLLP